MFLNRMLMSAVLAFAMLGAACSTAQVVAGPEISFSCEEFYGGDGTDSRWIAKNHTDTPIVVTYTVGNGPETTILVLGHAAEQLTGYRRGICFGSTIPQLVRWKYY